MLVNIYFQKWPLQFFDNYIYMMIVIRGVTVPCFTTSLAIYKSWHLYSSEKGFENMLHVKRDLLTISLIKKWSGLRPILAHNLQWIACIGAILRKTLNCRSCN